MSVYQVRFNIDDRSASVYVEADHIEHFMSQYPILAREVHIADISGPLNPQEIVYRRGNPIVLFPYTIQSVTKPAQYKVVSKS